MQKKRKASTRDRNGGKSEKAHLPRPESSPMSSGPVVLLLQLKIKWAIYNKLDSFRIHQCIYGKKGDFHKICQLHILRMESLFVKQKYES